MSIFIPAMAAILLVLHASNLYRNEVVHAFRPYTTCWYVMLLLANPYRYGNTISEFLCCLSRWMTKSATTVGSEPWLVIRWNSMTPAVSAGTANANGDNV